MKVLKFGGTSVGSAKNIRKVIEIVKNESLFDYLYKLLLGSEH